ncbi:MAG: hypothetical protein ABW187_08435 [Dokdonella sp.]
MQQRGSTKAGRQQQEKRHGNGKRNAHRHGEQHGGNDARVLARVDRGEQLREWPASQRIEASRRCRGARAVTQTRKGRRSVRRRARSAAPAGDRARSKAQAEKEARETDVATGRPTQQSEEGRHHRAWRYEKNSRAPTQEGEHGVPLDRYAGEPGCGVLPLGATTMRLQARKGSPCGDEARRERMRIQQFE